MVDFEGVLDPEGMSDDELYDVIMERFEASPQVQQGWIDLGVRDGFVTLGGRVGTDTEIQVAESIVTDIVGVGRYTNELMTSDLHRESTPEAADDAVLQDRESDDQLGEPDPQQSDTAEHLATDLEGESFGTHDMGAAIEDGMTYTPPDRPFPDGYRSTEDH